ncbi:hypothetical protein EWM64_g246 [Hericium alpestre]|uniref:RNA helicase n=1 Tax=Hericium alpestre TaxID=135208 RepID=A0A4Z0ABV5_9AGAM|nr:hypothetical protein EWM64_g246 [Hericium alpestre]
MAKKKKTQLKPVARGFATTSQPKKVVPVVEEEAKPDASVPSTVEGAEGGGGEPAEGAVRDQVPAAIDEFDPEKVEEQSLQNLVDKLQDKVEKEVVRTIKNIEMDRRHSKTFPSLNLDQDVVDHILQLVLENEQNGQELAKPLQEPEDKAIIRLGITYGVLRRLGFSEERVEQCLKAISGVDLEEAWDWLYLHCSDDELQQAKGSSEVESKAPRTPQTSRSANHTPRSSTVRTPSSVASPLSPTQKVFSTLDATVPAFIPSSRASSAPSQDIMDSAQKLPPDEPDSSSPPDDPNVEYVRVKLKLDGLLSGQDAQQALDRRFISQLRSRLEDLKEHYWFDERDAEAQYEIERQKAEDVSLQARLRGLSDRSEEASSAPPSASPSKPPSSEEQPPTATTPVNTGTNILDMDSDSEEGMFQLLEELPATEVNEQGTTVRLREMALPKHSSGRTPKTVLNDTVYKRDSYAVITYRCISGPSRAKRASANVRWSGGKAAEDWSMEDVACPDMIQAEQYIATVALHALTFPPADGFASGSTSSANGQTFFRLLPPAFRELWDELEIAKKARDDAINRAVWAKLRTIIEPKLALAPKATDKSERQVNNIRSDIPRRDVGSNRGLVSEQLITSFNARRSSPVYQEMLEQRNTLPIAQYRNHIIDVLETSQILVLSGETGCGKSTQVPAFILEDQLSRGKHCKIYCTEPRRISAISLAQRVSRELGDPLGAVGTMSSLVGYSIRLESNTSKNTRLTFVTNGIALRMLEGGSGQGGHGTAFDEITHIVIDEVHERSIESDFLLIVLKSLLQQRADLKVILMSATVDAEKISNYFGGCPILLVPGRTFPVDTRYLEDAVELTRWSITESSPYARRLHDKFYRGKGKITEWSEETAPGDDEDEETSSDNVKLEKTYSASTTSTINLLDERLIPYDLIMRLLERICLEDEAYFVYSQAILIFLPGIAEIRRLNDHLMEHPIFGSNQGFLVYPLHSTISSENQGAVFDIPPPGIRKLVLATNIAETGITIPDITCVIDTGKHREMRFDEKRQISRLVETFVAKSNAAQRRGRAGRVQRGLAFHLFTRIRHDTQLADHPDPEMMRLSLSDLALRIKILKVKLGSSIEDVLSRALDPPSSINIQRAISALVEVRALTPTEDITPLGRLLSSLPTDVHIGKFLLIATLFRCLDPALTIAATLNSKSPFLTPFGHEEEADRAKISFRTENSDFLTLHNVFSSWRRASSNPSFVRKFCRKNFLSHQNLQQIEELRQQFMSYLIDSGFIQVDRNFVRELSRARYGRSRGKNLAVPSQYDVNSTNPALINAALAAGMYPKILTIDSNGSMHTISNNQLAAFHPSSVNFRRKPSEFGVNHLAYFTLMQSKKLYAWETGPVDDISLMLLCGECEYKLISDSASLERKIRFNIPPKANIALKHLRSQLSSILASQLRGKPLTESQLLWMKFALVVLGKTRLEEESKQPSAILNVVLPSH